MHKTRSVKAWAVTSLKFERGSSDISERHQRRATQLSETPYLDNRSSAAPHWPQPQPTRRYVPSQFPQGLVVIHSLKLQEIQGAT